MQKLLSSMPQRLAEISQKKGGQLITSLCIDIRQVKLFFPSNGFLLSSLSPRAHVFLSPGVYLKRGIIFTVCCELFVTEMI